MPASAYHRLTATTPDDPGYEIRPSHWNSDHAVTLDLVGSEVIGAFKNDGGVSFGVDGDGKITAAAPVGGGGISAVRWSAGTLSSNRSDITFGNANGITFGLETNGIITASHNGLTQQSTQPVAASGSNGSFAFSTLSFGNSNGLSLYTTNGSIVGSYTVPTQSNQSLGIYGLGNTTGQSSSSTHDARTLSINGGGGVSVGWSNGSLLISGPQTVAQSVQSLGLYAVGNTTGQSSSTTRDARSISVQGAGGVSAGYSNGSLVISGATVPAQFSAGFSTQGNTAGDSGFVTGRLALVGGPNISLSGSTNGGSMTISISGGAGAAGNTGSISAGTTRATLGELVFANGGGVSFGIDGQTLTATVKTDYLTTAALSDHSHGASAANGSFGFQTISFSNANGISFGTSAGNAITASHNGLTSQSNQALSGSNGSFAFQTATFGNLNGASFYTSNGSMVVSYTVPNVPAQTNQTIGGYFVGNTTGQSSSSTVDARSISIDGAGIVSAGWSNGSIRISATQSNQAFSAAGGSSAFQTLGFSDNAHASFTNTNGSVALAPIQLSAYAVGNTTQSSSRTVWASALSFNGAGNISVGVSNGSIVISGAGGGAGMSAGLSNIGNTLGDTGLVTGRLVLAGGNNITLSGSTNGGSATVTISAFNQTNVAFSGNNASSTFQTLSFQASNGITFSNNAGAIRVTHDLAGTSTGFAGANISGSITHNSAGINLSLSVAAPGAAAENNWHHALGANTAGNTTASGSTIGLSGINLTISGTNNSVLNLSVPATSSLSATGIVSISVNGSTISIGAPGGTATMWWPYNEAVNVVGQHGQATMHIYPVPTPAPAALGELQVDRLCIPINWSHATNSTGSVTMSFWFGLYTKNASTLSLLHSTSLSTATTFSGTANSASLAGPRLVTIPWTTTIGDGRYYAAMISRTTTGGANCSISQFLVSQLNSNFSGIWGAASNRSAQWPLGLGVRSASTSGLPASVPFSHIDGTGSLGARAPSWFMVSGTA